VTAAAFRGRAVQLRSGSDGQSRHRVVPHRLKPNSETTRYRGKLSGRQTDNFGLRSVVRYAMSTWTRLNHLTMSIRKIWLSAVAMPTWVFGGQLNGHRTIAN
jgi:hypothetical protein